MNKNNQLLVIVDVQPSYFNNSEELQLIMPKIIKHMEVAVKQKRSIFAFFNNEDLSGDSPEDSKFFFLEQGLSEKAWGNIMFIEKDFCFLRNWMDSGVSNETIIKAVQVMNEDKIYDSRNFSENAWKQIEEHNGSELRTSEHWIEDYCIFQPQIDSKQVQIFQNQDIEMIGGGRYECLEELNLFLTANNAIIKVNENLCYGTEKPSLQNNI